MRLLAVMISLLMAGCSMVNYQVDDLTYRSVGKSERIKFIIVHYTACDDETSIETLTKENVSAHYLITTFKWDPIFQLVSDDKRSWHAGISYFQGRTNLNDTSIGIEIVNPGVFEGKDKKHFYPFYESQIKKTARLIRVLSKKYRIAPERVIGHSDAAPGRKIDPGPLFPWERLYKEGIGAWYDEDDFDFYNDYAVMNLYSVKDIQREFKLYGYAMNISGEWGEYEKDVLRAFQMHFRPGNLSGEMDLETFAIIKSLNHKYN